VFRYSSRNDMVAMKIQLDAAAREYVSMFRARLRIAYSNS